MPQQLCVRKRQTLFQKASFVYLTKDAFWLARPKGFEPPIFRIGICCVIRLRHGRKYYYLLKEKMLDQDLCSEGDKHKPSDEFGF